MHRMALIASGITIALVIGLHAARNPPAPGKAIAAGSLLPFIVPDAEAASGRVARKRMQGIEVLGLLIFILMAVVMLTVGAALFFDWLAESGMASSGMQIGSGLLAGIPGAVSVMDLTIGIEVAGGLSLVALYMFSGLRRSA